MLRVQEFGSSHFGSKLGFESIGDPMNAGGVEGKAGRALVKLKCRWLSNLDLLSRLSR